MDDKKNKTAKQPAVEEKTEEKKEKPTDVEVLKKESEDFKNKYLRALADYQNLEKRIRDEKIAIREEATFSIVLQLLPFLDHLTQAEIFIKDKGLAMIRQQFDQALKDIGIEEIDVLNKPFDPHVAEAVDVVEGEKDNIVIEVLRKGYRFHDKVIRPAQVKVSKKKQNS